MSTDAKPVDYEMSISFNRDGVRIKFTGESVDINNEGSPLKGVVRPRHIKLVHDIQQMMRQYYMDNK